MCILEIWKFWKGKEWKYSTVFILECLNVIPFIILIFYVYFEG